MNFFENTELDAILRHALTTTGILLMAFAIWLLLSRGLNALERRTKISQAVLLPVRLALRYGIMLVAALLLFSTYGIQIGSFWTVVSTVIGLVAIGFVAVWSVLSNLSATFLLLIFQPFRVGDYVAIVGEEVKGRVIDINFMFTTIRSLSGDTFQVPNNQFFQKSSIKPADPEAFEKGPDSSSPPS